jgi:putative multiple sugar transport system ATP-binding protein
MDDYILEMRSITKTFPGVKALSDVSLAVRRGEVHAICGENGAGKSTLMKVLSGVYPAGTYDGEIVYDGEVQKFGSIRDSEHQGIVIIHQELALVPYLSIAENIFLGNERKGRGGLIDWNRANADAAALLAEVGLAENPVVPVNTLGVGKQQLVEIAKAISKDVKLLILDEPTAALNDNDSAHLLDLLRRLRDRGITSIIISHKLNEIVAIAQHTTIIRDGKTVETLDMSAPDVDTDRSSAAWWAGTWSPTTPSVSRTPARRCCAWRAGRSSTPPRTGSSWTTRTSTSAPVRSSASPASWAPGAPSWR